MFAVSRVSSMACYGEVWTDEDFNILRMSEHCEPPGNWKHYESVVTYGWLQRTDETPRLTIKNTISDNSFFDTLITLQDPVPAQIAHVVPQR